MIHACDIVAWTYEADMHCEACAEKRFGQKLHDDSNPPTDNEGNPVHPVFESDEHQGAQHCGDCRGYLCGEDRELLIDGAAGIYVPRNFYERFDFATWGLKIEDYAALSSPDNDEYWDAWDEVLANAEMTDKDGVRWTLEQDGDLFAVSQH